MPTNAMLSGVLKINSNTNHPELVLDSTGLIRGRVPRKTTPTSDASHKFRGILRPPLTFLFF